jgi:hypothetical protein
MTCETETHQLSKLIAYSIPDKGVFSYIPFDDCVDIKEFCGIIIEGKIKIDSLAKEEDMIPNDVKITIVQLNAGFSYADTNPKEIGIPIDIVKRRLKVLLPKDRYLMLDRT